MNPPATATVDKHRTTAGLPTVRGDELFRHRLIGDNIIPLETAGKRDRFEALSRTLRDLLAPRWIAAKQAHDRDNPKQVYYLSMEFLIGRSLANNLINLSAEVAVQQALAGTGVDWREMCEEEPDAGLGNGGLGRLAACFMDSLSTLQIPAVGYGLRYEYGIFRQRIDRGYQQEEPDHWLLYPDPWEVARPRKAVSVALGSAFVMQGGVVTPTAKRSTHLVGIPYDRPVVGYGGKTVNTLRLWGSAASEFFDFGEFSAGDFFGAVADKVMAESLTRVLYPDDSTFRGRSLRFVQEYFLVACSLADIITRFRRRTNEWRLLPDKAAIQLNDTHPAMAVAELMRILLDEARLGWEQAWDITTRTLAYTNHTLLPEALEKWPVDLFEQLLPRQLDIIYEVNRRFLNDVERRFPGEDDRKTRMSMIEEGAVRQVRMAHLAVVGSHSVNGVAAIHSDLVKNDLLKDFAEMYPERFNNKTNGVTPRRWMLLANPDLSKLITDRIGDGWVTDLDRLRKLAPLAEDGEFRDKFRRAKRAAKLRFIDWLRAAHGWSVDPDSIFDSQIKRIHEYKRQLLNILHVVMLYNRLRANPHLDMQPRTFFFAGKAAPAYRLAKNIIKLITSVGSVIDSDPAVRGRLKVIFLPNYSVTLAERLIPATDISEQISTAGYEASGTGNMKFMMNGALTIGTRDGATIEMAEEAGEENFFLFGLTAEEVAASKGWYNPVWHYENEPEIKEALDLIFSDHFSRGEPGVFNPIKDALLHKGDYFRHLADLTSYSEAHKAAAKLYRQPEEWTRKAVLNVSAAGKFSSDRTIAEYAREIWRTPPFPLE